MIQLQVLMITTGKGLKCGSGDLFKINKCANLSTLGTGGDFFPLLLYEPWLSDP